MLTSVKIQKEQSELRQNLAVLAGFDKPSDEQVAEMVNLEKRYGQNEQRFRAALISEDNERREAGEELETRSDREYSALVDKFELRQVALFLDEGRALDGATAEVVQEMRSKGGYQGVPIPYAALSLEKRAGETVASSTPSPKMTAPIIDRLFPNSVASLMGGQLVSIAQGTNEYPIVSSAVSAAWQTTETGSVGGPTQYTTASRTISPNNTLGIQMKITRKTLKQSGEGLEQAVRRDMNGCMAQAMDKAVFLGAGSSGEPAGLLVGSYSITSTSVAAAANWNAFRAAVVRFIVANAVPAQSSSTSSVTDAVKVLIRPEVYDFMDNTLLTGTAVSEYERFVTHIGPNNVVMSSNALAAPTGTPLATKVLLATASGGVPPFFVGLWGGIDLIRDPYADAASGGLRLTALATMDVSAARSQQLQILTGVQVA